MSWVYYKKGKCPSCKEKKKISICNHHDYQRFLIGQKYCVNCTEKLISLYKIKGIKFVCWCCRSKFNEKYLSGCGNPGYCDKCKKWDWQTGGGGVYAYKEKIGGMVK